MLFLTILVLVAILESATALQKGLFRQVNLVGETFDVPFSYLSSVNKNVTTLLIAEKSKLKFVINTAISIIKHSGGADSIALLCIDCEAGDAALWGKKGLHIIGSKFLQEMAIYAFRLDGPMPHNAILPARDMRRHSIHMLYREWIKAILLENGLSVFLVDVDIGFTSSLPFFTAKEDVVLEARWPNKFRPELYSFKFGTGVYVVLNNGVAMFTPTPAMLEFGRQFMGMMVHSVVVDFGFAQTSFVKHLSETELVLKEDKHKHLVGKYVMRPKCNKCNNSHWEPPTHRSWK
jgi:hypothetical protein